jgi:activating signal cointegrator 1
MKTISIWNPFAMLLVRGFKVFETRTWKAPDSLIGQTLGIASTKSVLPAQRAHWADPAFQSFYANTGLPAPAELPQGFLLGTVTLDSVELMTEELMDDVSAEEQSYGWWQEGFYAWRVTHPRALTHPIPIRGRQGIYDWNGDLSNAQDEGHHAQGEAGS